MHGHALPGHGRLVDLALTLLHDPVRGDFRPGAYEQQIPDDHLGGGDLHGHTIPQNHGLRRGKVQEGANRIVGTAAGTHLEPVAQQDEGGQHGGCLVEDVPAPGEGDDQRVQPAGTDGDRHEHHHVQRTGTQGPDCADEEDRAGVEDHRQAQQQCPHVLAEAERNGCVPAEDLLADRRPDHDRDGERHRDQEAVAHVGDHRCRRHLAVAVVPLRLVGRARACCSHGRRLRALRCSREAGRVRFLHRIADVRGNRLAGAVISAFGHPCAQLGERGPPRVEDDRGRLRHRVDLDVEHAGPTAQYGRDGALLARAHHAPHIQHRRAALLARSAVVCGVRHAPVRLPDGFCSACTEACAPGESAATAAAARGAGGAAVTCSAPAAGRRWSCSLPGGVLSFGWAGSWAHTSRMPEDEAQTIPPEPLLQVIANLARFHREHEQFYSQAPLRQADELQARSRALKSLAGRWSVTDVGESAGNPFAGAEDLNAPGLVAESGILFMEGEDEPVELQRLKRMSGSLRRTATRPESGSRTPWSRRGRPSACWQPIRRLRICSASAIASSPTTGSRRGCWRWWPGCCAAPALLDRVTFSPAALRSDLRSERNAPAYLYSASELLDRAADLLAESATLVRDNERRWRVFGTRIHRLRLTG